METLKSKVGTYSFLVEPFHCDFSNRLFLGHLGNHLLNAADFHSNERGYGMNYLNTINKTWVLSRFVMEFCSMPKAYDTIKVDTWVDGVMKFFTSRNFSVKDGSGNVCGYGKSIWAMIDTATRQPVDILGIRDGLITQYIEEEKECPIKPFSRVKIGKDVETVRTIDTYYSDVDVNGHVNSVKYIEHILDLWSLDWHRKNRVKRFEIAYVSESHCGDRLVLRRSQDGGFDFSVSVEKLDGDSGDPKEACRARVVFEPK